MLTTLVEPCAKVDWQVHACYLMGNHFPRVVENAQGQLGGRDDLVSGHLHGAVQPAAQVVWPFLQRALQVAGGGRRQSRLSADGRRIGASESGAGEVAAPGAGAAGVSEKAGAMCGLAAGGAGARGVGNSEGRHGGVTRQRHRPLPVCAGTRPEAIQRRR